jgi:hypothetical protein
MIYVDGSKKIKTKKKHFSIRGRFFVLRTVVCLILDYVRKWTRVIEVKVGNNLFSYTSRSYFVIWDSRKNYIVKVGYDDHSEIKDILKCDDNFTTLPILLQTLFDGPVKFASTIKVRLAKNYLIICVLWLGQNQKMF